MAHSAQEHIVKLEARLQFTRDNKATLDQLEDWAEGEGCNQFYLDHEANFSFTGDRHRLLRLLRTLAQKGWRMRSPPDVNNGNMATVRLYKTTDPVVIYFRFTSTTCRMVETGEYETIRRPITRLECGDNLSLDSNEVPELASAAPVLEAPSDDIPF